MAPNDQQINIHLVNIHTFVGFITDNNVIICIWTPIFRQILQDLSAQSCLYLLKKTRVSLHTTLKIYTSSFQGFYIYLPYVAYISQRKGVSLVQVMAWRLFGAKSLHEPVLVYWQPDSGNIFQLKLNRKSVIFFHIVAASAVGAAWTTSSFST